MIGMERIIENMKASKICSHDTVASNRRSMVQKDNYQWYLIKIKGIF